MVCVGAWLIEGERVVISRLQRAGVPRPIVSGGSVRLLSIVNPRNRRPRSNGHLIGTKEEILDRNRHIVLRRGRGSEDHQRHHRENGQIQ